MAGQNLRTGGFGGGSAKFGAWGEDIQEGGKLEADVSQPVAPLRKLEGAGGFFVKCIVSAMLHCFYQSEGRNGL